MSNHISEVTIVGLWGRELTVKFPLGKQFNFIIGKNGTGKTTVINLIAAVLLADFERLDKIPFSRVVINLKPASGRKRPSIEVIKAAKPNLPYSDITFRIKLSSDQTVSFDLDAFAEERAYRGAPARFMRERIFRDRYLSVQRQLEDVVDVTWLSVNRGGDERERSGDQRYQSAVDQKLAALNIDLVKYFTKLSTTFDEKTKEFQRTSFLTLTQVEKTTDIQTFLKKIDVDHERTGLESIFKLLGVGEGAYDGQLTESFSRFAAAKTKFLASDPMKMEEFFALFNTYRAHSLVELYERLQRESAEIFQPRRVFLEVINGLLAPRKQAGLSGANELVIAAKDGRSIPLEDLSSGEKQLIIILGQALLQERKRSIYIADEPELSLHVEWQEQITSAIERLNPNAQIIFATHSPDIVGRHSDCIVDMERVFG